MTKECSISIQGAEEALRIESLGRYHEKDGRSYVFFEAVTEDGTEKCSLKFDDCSVEYVRKGAIRTGFVLKAGERTDARFETPYGSFSAAFHTGSLSVSRQEDRISLSAEYTLSLNGTGSDPGRVDIEIRASGG